MSVALSITSASSGDGGGGGVELGGCVIAGCTDGTLRVWSCAELTSAPSAQAPSAMTFGGLAANTRRAGATSASSLSRSELWTH